MVKWTTLDPCTCFNESDSKQNTNFEFLEKEEDQKHLSNTFDLQSQAIYLDKNDLKKNLHI